MITEGKAVILASKSKKISRALPVFYNPVMKLNRDISILLLNSIYQKDLQIADILAGTGIRSIRFLKELKKSKIKDIIINDYSKNTYNNIKKNLKINKLTNDPKVITSNIDANLLMLNSTGFDYIDIDPFGSPVPFLENAVVRLARNGILAVTATDTAALAGTSPNACRRRYSSKPLRNEFMHETGIRILIKKVQEVGAQNEKALTPIFSYAKEHYYRVFFRCKKGRKKADAILSKHGFVLYCRECLNREVSINIFNNTKCKNCASHYDYAGPLWLGELWDSSIVKEMLDSCSIDLIEAHNLLSTIKEEMTIKSIGFVNIHKLCKKYKLTIPTKDALFNKIKKAAQTHFSPLSIKTVLPLKELVKKIKN